MHGSTSRVITDVVRNQNEDVCVGDVEYEDVGDNLGDFTFDDLVYIDFVFIDFT